MMYLDLFRRGVLMMKKYKITAAASAFVLGASAIVPSMSAFAATKYQLKSGKLVHSKTKKVVRSYKVYKNNLYKNGKKYTGTFQRTFYNQGKKYTGTKKGIVYKKGKKLTGLQKSIYYKAGKKGTGDYRKVYYYKGKKHKGIATASKLYKNQYVKQGKPTSGSYKGKYYVKGKLAQGIQQKKYYKNGILHTGVWNKKQYVKGKLANQWYAQTFYVNGLRANGLIGNVHYASGKKVEGVISDVLYESGIPFAGTIDGYTYVSGKLLNGWKDDLLYVSGKRFTGTKDGITYKNGETLDGLEQELIYQDGKLFTGVLKGTRYKNGELFNGLDEGLFYKNGVLFEGMKDGIQYEQGKPTDGAQNDTLYENGQLFNGLREGKLYVNGKLWSGLKDQASYEQGILVEGMKNGLLYEKGLLFTGTKDGLVYVQGAKDEEAPVITVVGTQTIKYKGAVPSLMTFVTKVTDNSNEVITSTFTVKKGTQVVSSIQSDDPGMYTVTYTAKDKSGNVSEAAVVVNVLPEISAEQLALVKKEAESLLNDTYLTYQKNITTDTELGKAEAQLAAAKLKIDMYVALGEAEETLANYVKFSKQQDAIAAYIAQKSPLNTTKKTAEEALSDTYLTHQATIASSEALLDAKVEVALVESKIKNFEDRGGSASTLSNYMKLVYQKIAISNFLSEQPTLSKVSKDVQDLLTKTSLSYTNGISNVLDLSIAKTQIAIIDLKLKVFQSLNGDVANLTNYTLYEDQKRAIAAFESKDAVLTNLKTQAESNLDKLLTYGAMASIQTDEHLAAAKAQVEVMRTALEAYADAGGNPLVLSNYTNYLAQKTAILAYESKKDTEKATRSLLEAGLNIAPLNYSKITAANYVLAKAELTYYENKLQSFKAVGGVESSLKNYTTYLNQLAALSAFEGNKEEATTKVAESFNKLTYSSTTIQSKEDYATAKKQVDDATSAITDFEKAGGIAAIQQDYIKYVQQKTMILQYEISQSLQLESIRTSIETMIQSNAAYVAKLNDLSKESLVNVQTTLADIRAKLAAYKTAGGGDNDISNLSLLNGQEQTLSDFITKRNSEIATLKGSIIEQIGTILTSASSDQTKITKVKNDVSKYVLLGGNLADISNYSNFLKYDIGNILASADANAKALALTTQKKVLQDLLGNLHYTTSPIENGIQLVAAKAEVTTVVSAIQLYVVLGGDAVQVEHYSNYIQQQAIIEAYENQNKTLAEINAAKKRTVEKLIEDTLTYGAIPSTIQSSANVIEAKMQWTIVQAAVNTYALSGGNVSELSNYSTYTTQQMNIETYEMSGGSAIISKEEVDGKLQNLIDGLTYSDQLIQNDVAYAFAVLQVEAVDLKVKWLATLNATLTGSAQTKLTNQKARIAQYKLAKDKMDGIQISGTTIQSIADDADFTYEYTFTNNSSVDKNVYVNLNKTTKNWDVTRALVDKYVTLQVVAKEKATGNTIVKEYLLTIPNSVLSASLILTKK